MRPARLRKPASRTIWTPRDASTRLGFRSGPGQADSRRFTSHVAFRHGGFVPNFVPNPPEIAITRRIETTLELALQSQITLARCACKAVYTGSIPVGAFHSRGPQLVPVSVVRSGAFAEGD